MPAKREGGVSRSVMHGNTATRSRSSVAQVQPKAVVKSKAPMKVKRVVESKKKAALDLEDVIKAKPPKTVKA
eukprot:CAMPEP_0170388550 /NCGR_PEP_ID=MMETSP0117_2-20130122/18147_1 /TAXON_ID=400756 /ORGANISM="Durinskia baltica, Strain CSIRO CS-38" /LENGTH=71 /DNA_ID=CAMNT_0010644485 /DNA_START=41 /DNA_END=256 /DNA_ORIENTATION=+